MRLSRPLRDVIAKEAGSTRPFDTEPVAVAAPVRLRARNLPRLALLGPRGRGVKAEDALFAHDLDRLVVRCDEPVPLQVDGEDAGDVVELPEGQLGRHPELAPDARLDVTNADLELAHVGEFEERTREHPAAIHELPTRR